MTSQITWCDHLTSLPDYREALGLCLFRWREQTHQKAWIIRKNHQQGPFDVKMSHEQPRVLDVIHRQTHTAKQDKCVQTHAYNIACTIIHFFLISNKNSAELFQNLSVRQRFIAFPTSQCIKSKQQVMCFGLQDKTGHFLLIMLQKGRFLHLFLTNAGRGCCY